MQANASTRKHRCSTGAGTMQERCCIDAEGANAGSASMLCVHSIALHAGESGIDGAGKRNMLAVCLHCLHFSEQRITARRGGKRGVRGEMRGIVRRVPTCGAFRCAAGGRREDEEDEEDYGERRQRRGIVRRVPTCGAVRRRRLRPIRVRCSFLDSRGTMELAAREAVAEIVRDRTPWNDGYRMVAAGKPPARVQVPTSRVACVLSFDNARLKFRRALSLVLSSARFSTPVVE